MAGRKRTAISGDPGDTWTNSGTTCQWQLIVNWRNSCGRCVQYDRQIAPYWGIPFHYGCVCRSMPIWPGATAEPFVDFRDKIQDLDQHQQARVMGRSNLILVEQGVVTWDQVVTRSRILDLHEVVDKYRLTVRQMTDAGVSPYNAQKAWDKVHTPAHQQAAATAAELFGKLQQAGQTPEQIRQQVADRLAGRFFGSGASGRFAVNPAQPPPAAPPAAVPIPPPAPPAAPPAARPAAAALAPSAPAPVRPVLRSTPPPPPPRLAPAPTPRPAPAPAAPAAAAPAPVQAPRAPRAPRVPRPPIVEPIVFGPSTAKIQLEYGQTEAEVLRNAKKLLGTKRKLTLTDLASLAGATADATVKISAYGDRVSISTDAPDYYSQRTIKPFGKAVEIHNDYFKVSGNRGQGLGTEVFGRQVETARLFPRIKQISTSAARNYEFIGYKVWPRFGYDGPLKSHIQRQLQADTSLPDPVRNAKRIKDLFADPAGKAWWDVNGEWIDLVFDLKEGSYSRRYWTARLAAKNQRTGGNP